MMPKNAFDKMNWLIMAWTGFFFMAIFTVFWGVLARNMPPAGADLEAAQIAAHYMEHRMALIVGMSVCMVGSACYMTWGTAISRIMRRIEGSDGILSNVEMMGAGVTAVFPIVACGMWLTGALEVGKVPDWMIHVLYTMGWMIIDLAYMVTTFQIYAISTIFLRDTREKKLVPAWVCWWGYITCIAFFPVSLIPFFKTGPFAFHGFINFWIAFPTWYIFVFAVSFYGIKAVHRIHAEDNAGTSKVSDKQSSGTGAWNPAARPA